MNWAEKYKELICQDFLPYWDREDVHNVHEYIPTPVYWRDLLQWLNDEPSAVDYVDEALSVMVGERDLTFFELITFAFELWLEEIVMTILEEEGTSVG